MPTGEASVVLAEAALTSARKSKDKKAEAKALQDCFYAHAALPDAHEALTAAKALLKVQQALGDRSGQAHALLHVGEMSFLMDNLEDAIKYEQEALELFQGLSDKEGQETAKDALDRAHKKRGDVESAPNRAKGIAALGELTRSIEADDKTRFREAMNRCKRMGSVSQQDIEDRLCQALEKDYVSAARLFKEVLELPGLMPECKAVFVDKKFAYWGFRNFGGLHYGPAFQCTQGVWCNPIADQTMTPIVIPEGQAQWEYEVSYNSGILDGAIQAPFSCGFMKPAADLADRTFAEAIAYQTES